MKTEKEQRAEIVIAVLNSLIDESFQTATDHGFHDQDTTIVYTPKGHYNKYGQVVLALSFLAKIMSELGEAVEAVRLGDNDNLAEELADTIIRIMDTSKALGLDLPQALLRKMARNKTRPHKHGGKLA